MTHPCLTSYRLGVEKLLNWASSRHLDRCSAAELDGVVVTFFDEEFFKGAPVGEASRLLSALKHFLPEVSKMGNAALPRAHRSLLSWTKKALGQMRLPIPELILMAIIGHCLWSRRFWSAVAFFMQFRTYLRPGAVDALRVKQLVPPTVIAGAHYAKWGLILNPMEDKEAGKTGTFDDSIIWDTELWMHSLFIKLTANRGPDERLWPHSGAEMMDHFMAAVSDLNLDQLRPCRYGLRHGGASEDLLSGRRDHLAVKRRGGWRTDSSLKRYGKESRVLGEFKKVTPAVVEYGKVIQEQLEDLLVNGKLPPPPPRVGRLAPAAPAVQRRVRRRPAAAC